jgi:hypothetical protein
MRQLLRTFSANSNSGGDDKQAVARGVGGGRMKPKYQNAMNDFDVLKGTVPGAPHI